ncbi:kinase-like domain-containing protein [Powellomyces hirtus]|nr:kinase-like domain-containing protein [Powellomyces hirtus]
MQTGVLTSVDELTEQGGQSTEEDLIRFSMAPGGGGESSREENLIRFSMAPTAAAGGSQGDLIRFSMAGSPSLGGRKPQAHIRRSKKPVLTEFAVNVALARDAQRGAPMTDEAVLPHRLQLNYNTDLRIGEALPSNNKEKRIYAGTLAKDQGFMPRRIAIKHVWRNAAENDTQAAAGFVREVTIMAALSTHENVTRIVGYCTVPRVIVTDLYEGDLDFILGNRRFELPDSRGLSILSDVAKALAATHELGFAHGRLRPRAVLLERVKNTARVSVRTSILNFGAQPAQPRTFWRARVGDFSASRPDGANDSKARLAPRYAAPECIQSSVQVTSAGDVYSFGILAWQCLTRRIPWEGQEDGYIVWKVCEGERLSMAEIPVGDSPIRKTLVEIIARCCAEEPFARPTMQQLLTELEALRFRE